MHNVLWPLLIFILSLSFVGAQAQTLSDDCARVEQLMDLSAQLNTTPDQLIQGGGSIDNTQPIAPATITASDAGDRWVFPAASGAAQINISQSDLPLLVRVFRGNEQVSLTTQSGELVTDALIGPGGGTVTANLPVEGYHTVVVHRRDLFDATQTGSYTLNIGGNVSTGLAYQDVAWSGADAIAVQQVLSPTNGILDFSPERTGTITLRVMTDGLRSINVQGTSVGLELQSTATSRGRLSWPRNALASLTLLDGDLSATLANGGYLYIEDYPLTGNTTYQNAFVTFTIASDGRAVSNLDWSAVRKAWLLPGCMGFELNHNSERLIAPGTTLTVTPNVSNPPPGTPANQTYLFDGGPRRYRLGIDWRDINRVAAVGSSIDVQMTNNRSMLLDHTEISITQAENQPFVITNLDAGNTLLRTDWDNIQRIELAGDRLAITVQDLREVVRRTGRVLLTLETRDEVMRALWQDGSQTLMLPETADFIEIDTPAALDTYDNTLRPLQISEVTGAGGYLPANLNNTGQDCYPVNTALNIGCLPEGEVVNPANGNLSFSVTDHFARGARLDLALSRTYNSQNALVDGPFGRGWNTDYLLDFAADYSASQQARRITPTTTYPMGLDVTTAPLGRVIYTTGSGSRHVFERSGGVWKSLTMPGWTIAARNNPLVDDWHLLRDNGAVHTFDQTGRLKQIRHIHGGSLTVEREVFTLTDPNDETVYNIVDGTGRRLRLVMNGDHHVITSELYEGSTMLDTISYAYDAGGFLVAVEYSGTRATYAYDVNGLLVHHDEPRAPLATDLHYGYDAQQRVIWIDPSANVTPDQCSSETPPLRCYQYGSANNQLTTTTRGDWGRVQSWNFSLTNDEADAFRLLSVTGPAGDTTTYNYPNTPNTPSLISNFGRGGLQHTLGWDASGQITLMRADSWLQFSATYANNVVVDLNNDGTPDAPLSLLQSYQSDGSQPGTPAETFTYNESGQLLTYTASSGLATRVDARDNANGLPTLLTVTANDVPGIMEIQYDARGLPASREDTRGIDQYEWDGYGRLVGYQRLSKGGDELVAYAISHTLTSNGYCMVISDPLATATRTCYDQRDRLIEKSVTRDDTVIERLTYDYDDLDRLTEISRQVGRRDTSTTRYEYSASETAGNRRVIETIPLGHQIIKEYNAADRLVWEQDASGAITTYEYPPASGDTETVIQRDGTGAITTYEYNRARQLNKVDFGDVRWELQYGGQRTAQRREPSQIILANQLGGMTASIAAYNGAGYPTEINYVVRRPGDQNPTQAPVQNTAGQTDFTLNYAYDMHGQLTRIANPRSGDFTQLLYSVNDSGEKEVTVDTVSGTTVYTYDALDRLLRVDNAEGSVAYAYAYDDEAFLQVVNVTLTDPDGAALDWTLKYDSLGNLREWINEEGRVTDYAYDQASRLIAVSQDGEDQATYEYNALDQVTLIENEAGQEMRLTYNDKGQLTTRRDFNGVVQIFSYDQQGNIQAVSDGLGFTTAYRYDQRSRLAQVIDPIGREVSFDWSNSNRGEVLASSAELGQTRYYFDLFNRLWQIQDSGGNQRLLRYDGGGRVSSWQQAASVLDLAYTGGALTGISGPDDWTWAYDYNSLSQLIARQDPDSHRFEFDFDNLGRLISLAAPGGDFEQIYTRPEAGQLLVTQGDESTRYVYDMFGRRIAQTVGDEFTTSIDYDGADYTITDPSGIQTSYAYFGEMGGIEEPFLSVTESNPAGDDFRQHDYYLNLRGEIIGMAQLDYFPDAERPYRVFERVDYDAEGRPIRYIDPENNLYAFTYDLSGRLTSVQYPDGSVYNYEYNTLNRLTRLRNPTGSDLRFTYDNMLGTLLTIALNNRPLEAYSYSPLGWLTRRTFTGFAANTGQIAYTYSAGGVPQGWNINGQAVALEHSDDAFQRLTRVSDTPGTFDLAYDAAGRLVEVDNQQFAYDSLGQIISAGDIAYTLTPDTSTGLNTLSLTLPGGQTIDIVIDAYQHVQQVSSSDETIEVQYDAAQTSENLLELTLVLGEGYETEVRFNRLGDILRLRHDTLETTDDLVFPSSYAYVINYAGTPLAIDAPDSNIILGYDNVFRPVTTSWLANVDFPNPRDSISYNVNLSYNSQGNRIRELSQSVDGQLQAVTYTYDAATGTLLESRIVGSATASSPGPVILFSGLGLFGLVIVGRRRRYLLPLLALVLFSSVMAQPNADFTYRYNAAGHVAAMDDRTGSESVTTAFAYDGFGRLVTIETPDIATTFEYDVFGRLVSRETSDDERTEYRYNGDQLVSINLNGDDAQVVSLLPDQYLLVTGTDGSRWQLYDGQGTVRQSFVDTHTSDTYASNRFDILGRSLDDELADATPLELPLYRGMLYEADHNLYIGLDGRAYDPDTGRYLQRSSTGPDAAGNLYGFMAQPAQPPSAIFEREAFVEPLYLLDVNATLAQSLTAADVHAQHMPRLYTGWQDAGLDLLMQSNQTLAAPFNKLAQDIPTLMTAYNRLSVLPDAAGNFRLFDTANHVQPHVAAPVFAALQPNALPDVSLHWLPTVPSAVAAPRWFDPYQWRSGARWSMNTTPPQPQLGERNPGLGDDLFPLPLRNISGYGDLFSALADLPTSSAEAWLAEIEADVLPGLPASVPENLRDWLGQWLNDDTLPIWSQLRTIQQMPQAPARDVPSLNLH